MQPIDLSAFATTVAAHAEFVRLARAAEACDLQFTPSDPAGVSNRRQVAFQFRDPVAAEQFLAAFRATFGAAASQPPTIDGSRFSRV